MIVMQMRHKARVLRDPSLGPKRIVRRKLREIRQHLCDRKLVRALHSIRHRNAQLPEGQTWPVLTELLQTQHVIVMPKTASLECWGDMAHIASHMGFARLRNGTN